MSFSRNPFSQTDDLARIVFTENLPVTAQPLARQHFTVLRFYVRLAPNTIQSVTYFLETGDLQMHVTKDTLHTIEMVR